MSWTAPRTWVTGETLTSTLLNTHVRDNFLTIGGGIGAAYAPAAINTDLAAPTNWHHTIAPTGAGFSVRTIAAAPQAGQRLVLRNTAANPVALLHATAGTGAQLNLLGAASAALAQFEAIELIYDGTTWNEIDRDVSCAYATTLPANPFGGQYATLVDSITNPSYELAFRYNLGSSSTYKWECVGGTPIFSAVETTEAFALTSYGDAATVGPSVVIPRNGDWVFDWGMNGNPAGANIYMSPNIGGGPADTAAVFLGAGSIATVARSIRYNGITAATVKGQYRISTGSGSVQQRWLRAMPYRVS